MSLSSNVSAPVDKRQVVVYVEDKFDFSGHVYQALFESADVTAFQHPVWLDQFYQKMLASRKASPRIVAGYDLQSGQLIFVLPMICRNMFGVTLLENSDLGVTDYAAPIVHSSYIATLMADPTLRSKVSVAIGNYDLLRIKPIRDEHRVLWHLFFDGSARKLNFQSHASNMSRPYDLWRTAAFGKSQIKYIDRRARKLSRHGQADISIVNADEVPEALSFLIHARAGRFEGDPIQKPPVAEFYRAVAEKGLESDYSRLYQFTCDGNRVGVIFGTCHAGRYYYLLIGCDYKKFGKFSPGLIMYDQIMRDWCAEGGDVFDFTIGDEAFKKDFGSEPTDMFELLNANSLLGKLAASAYRLKQSRSD